MRLIAPPTFMSTFIGCSIILGGQVTDWGGHHPDIAHAEIGHRSITMSHLGNIAMKLQQDLNWDPKTEQIINNDLANGMLTRKMRDPWATIYNKYVA